MIVGNVGSAFCARLTAGAKTRGRNRLTASTAPLTAAETDREIITSIWTALARGPLTSALIHDDRPHVCQAMTDLLRPLPGLNQILCVTEGFELIDTYTSTEVDLVLIGIHQASTTGADATSLLLTMHPTAAVIVSARSPKPTHSPPLTPAAPEASSFGTPTNHPPGLIH